LKRGGCEASQYQTFRRDVRQVTQFPSEKPYHADMPNVNSLTRDDLARRIDHTLLKPEATAAQIEQLCEEALKFGIIAVCVNPVWVDRCAARLEGSSTRVCTVAGFPLGASASLSKAYEAALAVERGALEVDMVISLGHLVAGDDAEVTRDIAAVVAATRRAGSRALVKVIIESRALTDAQIVRACRCCRDAGADFIKTSTGFHPAGGATVENVSLMKQNAGDLLVKAAGGIRDLTTAQAMLAAGADRLGMSASVAVLESIHE
jgi:deoxyribose-phosphate aldolase